MNKLNYGFDRLVSAKVQRVLALILVALGFLFFYIAYDTWEMQQEFLTSEKIQTKAVVKVDENQVKTLNFPQNSYGIATDNRKLQAGDVVTVYYQKNKPYRVSTSANQYGGGIIEVLGALFWGCFFIFFVILNRVMIPRSVKKYGESAGHLME